MGQSEREERRESQSLLVSEQRESQSLLVPEPWAGTCTTKLAPRGKPIADTLTCSVRASAEALLVFAATMMAFTPGIQRAYGAHVPLGLGLPTPPPRLVGTEATLAVQRSPWMTSLSFFRMASMRAVSASMADWRVPGASCSQGTCIIQTQQVSGTVPCHTAWTG